MASPRQVRELSKKRLVTGTPLSLSMTSVSRGPDEMRENSMGNDGPPSCHLPTRGNSRGSQINDPQPKIAILISRRLAFKASTARKRRYLMIADGKSPFQKQVFPG